MIKIGLIGTGFMGGMHAACYEALLGKHNFRVTAVADADINKATELAKKFGAQAYSSASDLIMNADVTAVDICLPTFLHKDIAIQAMRKGYDVFIEKPVCLTGEEADELLQVQQETSARVMVGHCIRFWPEYMELKQIADSGQYGRIVSGVFKRISPKPDWAWQSWLDDPLKSGTAALDLHIHDVDFVRYLLGTPKQIQTETVKGIGVTPHIFALYTYDDAVISLEGGWDYPKQFPFEMAFRVKFEQATVVFSSASSPSFVIYENNHEVIERTFEAGEAAGGGNISSLGGYINELAYFISSLENGTEIANSSLTDGCDSLRLTLREIALASKE
ncbi:Gfo/Idh/MocA family protein [Cohnella silvisoli]|uniref:Gfo/Idh/MocA family oxidoreductase n=1 Tax=Cohnella silvisoli TaxID=2873699 RepID=A0ABV1L0K6_9BACL|nr:Gfo/Idh/MocA family oxidoreductase [Cohnella silvisoli]MCD9025383.1 Gfo/Idh/MocA family oxidoreductase [Cohnella silvisoli]